MGCELGAAGRRTRRPVRSTQLMSTGLGVPRPVAPGHLSEINMNRAILSLCTLMFLAVPSVTRAADDKPAAVDDKPHIDIVFCIDCSGSMGPVIETAKQKVWAIVNQTAKAKPAPVLRIGLFGYGYFDKRSRAFPLT